MARKKTTQTGKISMQHLMGIVNKKAGIQVAFPKIPDGQKKTKTEVTEPPLPIFSASDQNAHTITPRRVPNV